MMGKFVSDELSIENKVEAAITHLRQAGEAERISVARVCKIARVSRANLYTTHPRLVDRIRSLRAPKYTIERQPRDNGRESKSKDEYIAEVRQLRAQISLLQYLCVELKVALREEKERTQLLETKSRR